MDTQKAKRDGDSPGRKDAAAKKRDTDKYNAMVAEADKVLHISWLDGETLNRVLGVFDDLACSVCDRALGATAWIGDKTGIAFCQKGCIARARREYILSHAEKRNCARCRREVNTDKDFTLNAYGLWHDKCIKAGPRRGTKSETGE